MMSKSNLETWFLRVADAEAGGKTEGQVNALLNAFARIEHAALREEIVILVEIVSKMPSLPQRRLIENPLILN
jgi:hypothetical protein